ncbi:hybrid sensor histidine kinase/response regulator [Hyalangium sp.]|uniref:hybrid sensor histidine kinase/response regulator n=1 Tax=Hyalangium sp. TaxID=2028555 RepID=UPI002D320A50|nr:ATP-binding protein [Hyalangium sp.]HYH95416.1 ATP-binding protein [Hyalangium sp.]
MHVILVGIAPSVGEQLERALQEQGLQEGCIRLSVDGPQEAPRHLSEGLVVLGDPGRSLEDTERLCRELHSRRSPLHTHLVVLTERPPSELGRLIQAGADECAAPPGGDWGSRVTILSRRLGSLGHSEALPGVDEPPSERLSLRAALQALLDSTRSDLGYHFFSNLVEHLSRIYRSSCVLVGELLPERDSIRTLAFWLNGSLQRGIVYSLRGTPCDEALRTSVCHVEDGVAKLFPDNEMLAKLGMRGYLGVPLKDANGNALGILAILHHQPLEAEALEHSLLAAFAARASTELERIRAQEELERTRDFLRNTLNEVPDPFFVMDRAHRWVVVNRAFCEFMGRSEQELVGSSARDFLPARTSESFWQEDEQLFTSGQGLESERVFEHTRDGQPRTILTKKAVFHEPGGGSFLIAVFRDNTDRRRLETQLRLADRLSSIGTLAAGVVHEINNPLSYVCSNLSFLQKELAQPTLSPEALPELREVVAETQEGINRVRTIVQDVKTFARSDENHSGPVDVHQAIDGALRLVRKELQYRAQVERSLEQVPAILGNEGRLGQVLVNLLVNALQAFPQNDPARNRVIVSAHLSEPGLVVIEVEDNGPGMSPEVRQRLFDPFFTTKPAGEGTGLGLSICQSIIQSMGGKIEVESEQGQGSVFRLLLPAAQASASVEARAQAVPVDNKGVRRRLLLIDAEPAVGTSVRRLLQEVHEVDSVQDVGMALSLLSRGERYDAILCDVVLPDMSGVDLLRELEQREPGLARRTGFMTSGAHSTSSRELMASYSGELLEKPFEPERLRRFVQRLFT